MRPWLRLSAWALRFGLVAAFALVSVAPPAKALDLDPCNNTDAPIPASPYGDGSWTVKLGDPEEGADPFDNPDEVTLESVYGTTPKWATYDNGCTGQFMAGAGSSLGNILLQVSGLLPNWSHALLNATISPDSPVRALDSPVIEATRAVTDAVWKPWVTIALLLVAVIVMHRARDGRLARSLHAAVWAGLVLVMTTWLISYPEESVDLVDDGVRAAVTLIAHGFDDRPAEENEKDPAVAAIDGQMDQVVRSTMYRAWLTGAFGDPDSETARNLGPDLFRATHWSFAEYEKYREDPTGAGKKALEAKQAEFKRIAEDIERQDPRAYGYFTGDDWSQRVLIGLVNLVVVMVTCGFMLLAGLTVLMSFVLIRMIIPFSPAAGVLFLIDHTRDIAVGWLKWVVGPLVTGPVLFLVALLLLRFYSPLLSSDAWFVLKIATIGVLTVAACWLVKPGAYGIGHVRTAAGTAWGFVGGWRRTVTPYREAQPDQPSAGPPPGPPEVAGGVFHPPQGLPPVAPALAAASVSEDERSSWSSMFDTYPRGPSHSAIEKARWYAEATRRGGLLPEQRNWAKGHWFNHATAHRHRATEVTLHHLDDSGNVVRVVRLDALGDDESISKKNFQFSDVQERTWKRYIDEQWSKYEAEQADVVIAPTKGAYDKVARGELDRREIGQPMTGEMVFGVPPQRDGIPQEAIDYAAERGIRIEEYEPHPDAGEPE